MLGLFSLKGGAGSRPKPAEDTSTRSTSAPVAEQVAAAEAQEESDHTLLTCVPVPPSGRAPTSRRATNRPAWAFQARDKHSVPVSLSFAAEHGTGCICCTGVQVK
jgi:hypothetical protein